MKVELLNYTPLNIGVQAIRTCWDSNHKSDGAYKDKSLMDRVINKYRHESTIEHLVYNFDISGISRALLQELARHRIASLSVKSTRYTLKELRGEPPFVDYTKGDSDYKRASQYILFIDNDGVDRASFNALERLRWLVAENNVSNDKAKYCMPECYKTQLIYTINARSLRNLLALRTTKEALPEFQKLAKMLYNALPQTHQFLFVECMSSK